jgi:double-strand break repair protein MRE11
MPPRRTKPADAHHRSKPPSDPNTFRVLIATDTHLGAHESNAIRKDDAFLAFEEIFQKAKAHAVDAVFLAGDVFDVNKPSRETLVRCMDILREHTRGDASVEIEVLSDAKENFPSRGASDANAKLSTPVQI